ncbi:MAG: hypothetical protein U0821_01675 [Chloroflexota bacterium]
MESSARGRRTFLLLASALLVAGCGMLDLEPATPTPSPRSHLGDAPWAVATVGGGPPATKVTEGTSPTNDAPTPTPRIVPPTYGPAPTSPPAPTATPKPQTARTGSAPMTAGRPAGSPVAGR